MPGGAAAKRKGSLKERQTKRLLEDDGYVVIKVGGSLGAGDLVAGKKGERTLLVQVKASSHAFKNFGPAERAERAATATRAGWVPLLAWWRPRARAHELIEEFFWP